MPLPLVPTRITDKPPTTVSFTPYKPKYSTRKADTQPLKDGIQDLLKAYRIQGKISQQQVLAGWEKIMGKGIALKTKELYFKDRKLFITLTSAPLKHELNMSKTKVIDLINREIGQDFLQEVVFL
jgi:predicted nucleic acid-binding Zn ribbon protein